MKIINYTSVTPTHFDNDQAKGVAGRVVVGKKDGANNFCMRIFEIAPGGNTPKHAHAWEHEMFIHAGVGEIYGNGKWGPVKLELLFLCRPMKNIKSEIPARNY